MQRRSFIQAAAAAVASVGLESSAFGGIIIPAGKPERPVCIFSKCLQFLSYEELGEALARMGFHGADLTVRPGGHVSPENVARDLPEVKKALNRNGVDVYMIATQITDAGDAGSEKIMQVASELGIHYYRLGRYRYDPSKSLQSSLDEHKRTVEKLEKLNRKYGLHGGYQNHSGTMVGGPVWDLYEVLKDVDPDYLGVQYDICHATTEGGLSWSLGMKRIAPWIRTIDVKDFLWGQLENGRWRPHLMPLGKGMVDYDEFLRQYKELNIKAPVSIHCEYDLGGAELGEKNPSMPHEEIYRFLVSDLDWLRSKLKAYQLNG